MPTLVWIRRPESGSDADDATSRRKGEDAAVPDPVVSAASAADTAPDDAAAAAAIMPPAYMYGVRPAAYGIPLTFTTQTIGPYHHHQHQRKHFTTQTIGPYHHHQHQRKHFTTQTIGPYHHHQHQQKQQRQRQQPPLLRRHATEDDGPTMTLSKHDGRRKKRKMNRAGQATAAKKKSMATPGLVLPTGVYKTLSGKFQARIHWDCKYRHVGTFDTPEQASAAFISMRKDLRACPKNAGSAIFDEAKKKALESLGGFEREFPRGVGKASSGRFRSSIHWGGKSRYIGTFDTPEQASATFMSVRKDLDDANLSAFGAGETDTIFDAAKEKARKSIKSNV